METNKKSLHIGNVHGIDIAALKDGNGKIFVPVRPICVALGIDYASQYTKIKEDESFGATVVIITTVGADGKNREMVCLPVKHICGWIYSINPGKVAPGSKQKIIAYREEVNDMLTAYFFGESTRQIEANKAEIKILEEINACLRSEKEYRTKRKEAEKNLDKIRAARLDNAPSLFD